MLAVNFIPFPELKTERLIFRQLVHEDEDAIFKLRSDERVNTFLTRSEYKTSKEAGIFINKINKNVANAESIYWGIALQSDNKPIGTICLWNIQRENYRAEIGYELSPDFWGQGIMNEAIARVIDYGFDNMKLHSIQADTHPDNSRSIKLLEKNGFVLEGRFRESEYFNGKFSDRTVYSLLKR